MSTDDTPASAFERGRAFAAASGRRVGARTALALVAVTAVSLSVRLFGLGSRVFHWDEARVGYWILRYAETGNWEYHAIIHGPFLYHVDKYLFQWFGASDFVARFPVAVVTGLLPLSAWLFRERLRRVEMVALAGFFALNPVLLYYSRFMRNDALLAALAVFALGFFVRLADTGRPRYLYAGTLALALAFTTKENVLVYVLTWTGAAYLLFDRRLITVATSDERRKFVRGCYRTTRRRFDRWWPHLTLAVALFFAVVVFFYAPRAASRPGVGLWKSLSNPAMIPEVIRAGTVGAWREFAGTWAGGKQDHAYIPFFKDFARTLWQGAAAVAVLSLVGFAADRYGSEGPRDLVGFTFYWGFVSVFGYPIITDISAPWATIHAVVPLAVPAAVGLALFVRWGAESVADGDGVSAALAALLVLLVVGQVAATAVDTSYAHAEDRYLDADEETENDLVQYGQPAEGIRPTLETVRYAVVRNEGTDVLYYGSDFYVADESANDDYAAGKNWYNRLPLPWYTENYGATVESTTDRARLEESNVPPVVVARATDSHLVERRLDGYRTFEHELTLWGSETVFFVDEEYLPQDGNDS